MNRRRDGGEGGEAVPVWKRLRLAVQRPIEQRLGRIRHHLDHRELLSSVPSTAEALRSFEERWSMGRMRAEADREAPSGRPVFVLSAGWRSGSTLLQRLVMSDPSILVWGEPYHKANIVPDLAASVRMFSATRPDESFFLPGGPDEAVESGGAWIANLYPSPYDFWASQRAYLLRLFQRPAARAGRSRWGLKEVRLGRDEISYLRWLFADALFVLLVRNPLHAYRSYRANTQWYVRWPDRPVIRPSEFGRLWADLAGDFLELEQTPGTRAVRYEDLSGEAFDLENFGTFLDLELDRTVLDQRVSGPAESRVPLESVPVVERRAIVREAGPVAARYGYDL